MREEIILDTRSATIGGQSFFVDQKSDRPLLIAVHGGGFNSAYFEGPCSLPKAAAAAGFDTVLLNRPGAPPSLFKQRCADILSDNAEALDEAIEQIWRKDGSDRPGIFLVGHSIGGAVALLAASRSHSWPLMAISVSGIGDRPPDPPPYSTSLFDSVFSPMLPRPAMALLFMAPGTASEPVLDALEAVVPDIL